LLAFISFALRALPHVLEMVDSGVPEISVPATALYAAILAKLPTKPDGTPWTREDIDRLVDAANAPLAQVFAIYGDALPAIAPAPTES
jgi:hypothetical protein